MAAGCGLDTNDLNKSIIFIYGLRFRQIYYHHQHKLVADVFKTVSTPFFFPWISPCWHIQDKI
jgi:hypothetical protein